jgi:cytochrome c556
MKKEFSDFLYYNKKLELYRNRKLKIESNPDETLADFKIKIQEILKKRYEDEIEKLKEKYEEKEQKLEKRLRRAEDKLEKEQDDVTARTTDTILGFGMTLLDAFLGRKTIKRSTATRAAGSLRSAGRVFKEKEDVKRAEEEVKSIEEEIRKLDDELKEEIDSLEGKYNIENYEIETFYIKPRRSDIYNIDLFLCWESR